MPKFSKKYISLRTRFLMATAVIILALTLSYGIVAIAGYLVHFDKTSYAILRSQSNLLYTLAKWKNSKLEIIVPKGYTMNCNSLALIYDNKGNLLWRENNVPELENGIKTGWLQKNGFYTFELKANDNGKENCLYKAKTKNDKHVSLTYFVAVSIYPATNKLPKMAIVIIDALPQDIQASEKIWKWFGYVLIANLFLVIPLIWLAADWSLRPIKSLIKQVNSLEKGKMDKLDDNPPIELKSLVRNLNTLLSSERERYAKFKTTLSDLAHSLKTSLAVLQTSLHSLHSSQKLHIEQIEPIMLEQIGLISRQISYYLHRANLHNDNSFFLKKIVSIPTFLNELVSGLKKIYAHKGILITLDVSPEVTWLGVRDDLWQIMGNILDNACKYCEKLVKITATMGDNSVTIVVDNDGLAVPPDKREMIFQRGLRADTLRSGQGLGLSMASETIEKYEGEINIDDSPLGGTRVSAIFRLQNNNKNNND
ncbi:two-component system sensor histidine kinase PhoQ [Xenorhabdus sp. XENO-10]|uniref:histidine kinase n=1 Tax=Xenorhabdus yunnanensis TaxID=3025878 RepID=A0ABT5LF96_9GAMM|nr:two-component system sensor histidine kinase PhoQ [Xenorhabdus yunnanensis]MDC9589670.1 two-component system sensor histidine kinase PhoQ [Xenorhabdus yunnanensis]